MKQLSVFITLVVIVLGDRRVKKSTGKNRHGAQDLEAAASVHAFHPVGAGIGYGGSLGGYGGKFVGGGVGYGGGIGLGAAGLGYGGAGLGYGGAGLGLGGAGIGYGGAGLGLGGAGVGLGAGQFIGGAVGPVGYLGGIGGGYVDKNAYSGGGKNLNDEKFENAHGSTGGFVNNEQQGFNAGQAAVKDIKGDSGFFNEHAGGSNIHDDEKAYQGAKKYNQEGNIQDENKLQKGHKKGHVIKGFKTSSHKDESSRNEEYYDEENDEGLNRNFNQQGGSFAENSGAAFKGEHEDGKFNAGQAKKEGHYDKGVLIDNNNAQKGAFGEKQYAGDGVVYGVNNGVGAHSQLGHQEASKVYKHHPYIPFY